MYTIGQVSEMFHLPISTLRYYDKEGFFPNLVRKGNIRYFRQYIFQFSFFLHRQPALIIKKT